MASYWDRYRDARISRRAWLRAAGAGAAAAGAVALAGCENAASKKLGTVPTSPLGPVDQPDVLNPAGPPRRGGRFATANSADFGTFDPHLGIAVASAYFPRVYNVLVNQSPTRPEFMYFDLATSFETPDDTTYVFKIRPGVKIAPNKLGVPERDLDGEDVKASLERMKADPATTSYAFASKYIDSVTVSGDAVTVKTAAPYAWFISRAGSIFGSVAPRELLAGDLARLADKTAGAGPYRLTSVTEGERARFDRNPNYYRKDEITGAQLPYVDGLDVGVVFDRAAQRTAFQSGQIHAYMTATGEEARGLKDAVLTRDPNFAYISITMNPKRKPFDDPRVRRAISRAIDRREYVRIVYGGDAQADGLVHWPLGSYALAPDELEQTYQPFDLADAKALVSAVGGIKFKMMYPGNTSIEEHGQHLPIFVEQMRAAGIEIDQDPQAFGAWIENYHAIKYDSSLALNQIYETPELPLTFHTTRGPFGDQSYVQGIGDAEIDAAVDRANQALSLDARRDAVHAAQKVIYSKDPAMLPLVSPYIHMAYAKVVKNIPAGFGTTNYLLNTFWMDV
ncbi:MAG: ABC transporter substrate-binding protein [Chloroflexota bacterium]